MQKLDREEQELLKNTTTSASVGVLASNEASIKHDPSSNSTNKFILNNLSSSISTRSKIKSENKDNVESKVKGKGIVHLPEYNYEPKGIHWKANAEFPFLSSSGGRSARHSRPSLSMLAETVEERRGEENESQLLENRVTLIEDKDEFNRRRPVESSENNDFKRPKSLDVKRSKISDTSPEPKKTMKKSKFGAMTTNYSKSSSNQRLPQDITFEKCIKEDLSEETIEVRTLFKHNGGEGTPSSRIKQSIDKSEPIDESWKIIEHIPDVIAEERGEGEESDIIRKNPAVKSIFDHNHKDAKFACKLKQIEDIMIEKLTPRRYSRTCSNDIPSEPIMEEEEIYKNDKRY